MGKPLKYIYSIYQQKISKNYFNGDRELATKTDNSLTIEDLEIRKTRNQMSWE